MEITRIFRGKIEGIPGRKRIFRGENEDIHWRKRRYSVEKTKIFTGENEENSPELL